MNPNTGLPGQGGERQKYFVTRAIRSFGGFVRTHVVVVIRTNVLFDASSE